MKNLYHNLSVTAVFFSAILISAGAYSQKSEQEREREEIARENQRIVPSQVITRTQFQIGPPRVVNFTQVAEYERSHPRLHRAPRDIEQGEEKFDGYKMPPASIRPDAVHANVSSTGNEKASINSPAPILSFNGVLGDGSVVPPDIELAAGNTYVLETTNQSFALYNKNGTLASSIDIGTFFGSVGTGYFDPHCLYDPINSRYLAVIDGNIASNGDGGLFLAISETSDPTGNWYVYDIDNGDNSSNDLLDFPLMGFNTNWVVLTDNDFIGNNVTADIWIMDRASLYSGTRGTVTHSTDGNAFSISPAQTMDAAQTTEYLVFNDGNGQSVEICTVTGPVGTPTYAEAHQLVLSQTWSETTVEANQEGSTLTLDNDDTRIYNSVLINGHYWFSHNVFLPANNPTYSGVDWAEINPSTLAVIQYGRVSDPNGVIFYYYPAINVNSAGDALLQFDQSSSSEYASAGYCFHAAADAVNTMENPYIYKSGVAGYDPNGFGQDAGRWGDFNGAAVDPADNSFWGAGEWSNTGNNWATQIVHVGPSTPPDNPPVASFVADVTTTCTGIVQFTDQSTNDPTSWLWTFGDGTSSTLQNPTHDYTTNGTYTVTLTATNTYGSNTATSTAYITVSEPAGPTASNVTHCGPSTFSLSASTTNPVAWFDSGGTLLSTANPFVTPLLSTTTTYYVEDTVVSPTYEAGPVTDGIGTGGYLNSNWALVFNVMKTGTLVSINVYANGAGDRTFQITNAGGTVLSTATVNCPNGESTITLNFPLTIGGPYYLGISGTVNLYRNNAGASYPYTDPDGILSITGNNVGTVPSYYYYFYDWIVEGPNCISERTTVQAIIDPAINVTNIVHTSISCFGGTNGTATITPTGGTSSFTYSWSNTQTTATATNLTPGTYTVTVKDAASCTASASTTVTQPNELSVSVTPVNTACGASNGSATASVSGGTQEYNYAWSTGSSAHSVSNLAAGTYSITITDAHSCTASASFTISGAGGLTLNPSGINVKCFGGATGSATVTVTGATGTITYSWSNSQSSATINNLTAGTYTVTVSDGTGCSTTTSQTLTQPAALDVSVTAVNTGCGAPNGSATAVVTGGTTTYTYLWNTSATTQEITSLNTGTYTLTVTDANSCIATSTAIINSSGLLNVTTIATQPGCYGASTGSATASIAGGTGSITYTWSNGGGDVATVTNLSAGTYTVTAVDGTGCSGTSSIAVTQPAQLVAAPTSTAAGCSTANGTATANPSGGTVAYSYNWSNGGTTATITNLASGVYTLTVTDHNICTATASVTVIGGSTLTLTSSTTAVSCYNVANGSATVTVTSGNGPYTYAWSNGGNNSSINNIPAGSYLVTITDASNCQRIDTLAVTQPNPVTIYLNVVEPTCDGLNNGAASASATGGTGAFTFLWSTGSILDSINSLAPGTYSITLTDANSCTAASNFTITNPTPVSASVTSSNDSCNGVADGFAQAGASGGTPPYYYAWNTGANTATINNLGVGSYVLTISDSHNCTAVTTVQISQPPAITFTTSSTNATNGLNNGSATVSNVENGNPPYNVTWSNLATTITISDLAPGNYTVTVTDSRGCEQSETVVINNVTGIANVNAVVAFSLYPNPAKTEITVSANNLDQESRLMLEDVLGQILLTKTMSPSQTQVNVDLSSLSDGVYLFELQQGEKRVVKKFVISR